jgi:hypothetical protein
MPEFTVLYRDEIKATVDAKNADEAARIFARGGSDLKLELMYEPIQDYVRVLDSEGTEV